MNEYHLDGQEFIKLCDLMKKVGMSETGGQAKQLIAEGLVYVDGEVELRKRCKIVAGQVIEFDGSQIKVTG